MGHPGGGGVTQYNLQLYMMGSHGWVTSRKLKGPTAQGLICKQTALRTEHDSIAKN